MKRFNRLFLVALALGTLLSALPMTAAGFHHGGGGRGGGGGGGGRIVVRGGWGWGGYWGGWGWPGSYGPYERAYAVYGPSSQWAAVDTDISPEEARVYLDGRYIGTADDFDGNPDYLYLQRGHYKLEFRLDGYETRTIEIDAKPGSYLDLTDKLRKGQGAARRGSYEKPSRLEGGIKRYFGKRGQATEEVTDESEVTADYDRPDRPDRDADGDREPAIRDRAPERPAQEWRGERRPGARREDRSARAQTRLRLNVEPSDAAVYVDDRFVGTAEEVNSLERGISVSAGKHTVTISRPGFKDKTSEVTVESGQTQSLEISLGR